VTTAVERAVEWPAWDDPAWYLQDLDTIQASMAAARRASPVYWYDSPNLATGFWVLSTWEHQRYVSGNPELFCNRYGFSIGDASKPDAVLEQLPEWAREQLRTSNLTAAETRGLISRAKASLGRPDLEILIYQDPPRHTQLRGIFMNALKPSLIRSLRPRIGEITDEYLDRIEPGSDVDFVKAVGRIPAEVMAELIGIPHDMRETFMEMSLAQAQAITVTPDKDADAVAHQKQMGERVRDFCDELLERRKSDGNEDDLMAVVSRLALDGGPAPREFLWFVIMTFNSAGGTTQDLVSLLALALAERPEQRRLLVDEPELIPNALEETLRYYPINWSSCRTATKRVEIDAQTIEKDDYVLMPYASANRDEGVWERADEFDVTRSFDHDHFGFAYGAHSCPGALLARISSRGIWERLLERFPSWEMAGEPVISSTPFLRALVSLPVRFH
jgi:cytochrome P450